MEGASAERIAEGGTPVEEASAERIAEGGRPAVGGTVDRVGGEADMPSGVVGGNFALGVRTALEVAVVEVAGSTRGDRFAHQHTRAPQVDGHCSRGEVGGPVALVLAVVEAWGVPGVEA